MKQMEMILKGGKTRGVPANVTILEFFCCPVCNKEKTKSLPAASISDKTYLPISARFHGDFRFYNTVSVCGFTCFLLMTEAITGYKWIFCQQSKHPPINLLLWFVKQMILRLGVPFAVLQTDGGGEVWGSKDLCNCLAQEAQVVMEPTGAYNSAANPWHGRTSYRCCMRPSTNLSIHIRP
jgi:hypothetical protein